MITTAAPTLHVAHASGLHAVEHQLALMHQEMLRNGGEDAGMARLSVLNLVAACTDPESAEIASQTVGLIAQAHPARAIIVLADRTAADGIEADVSLQCTTTPRGQICAEQVMLTVGGRPARHLGSVITPLLVSDVPVVLWLVGAPPLEQAFGSEAIALCERIIVDTGAYDDPVATIAVVTAALNGHGGEFELADLAWARLRRWRELVAQAFDGTEMRGLVRHITAVEICANGVAVSAGAWLFAGWLAAQLRWRGNAPRIEVSARVAPDLPRRELLTVRVRCETEQRTAAITVERQPTTLGVTIEGSGGPSAARAVPLRDLDTVRLVGGLLEETAGDPVYPAALRSAHALAKR